MPNIKPISSNYKSLISWITNLLAQARHSAVQQINTILVTTYRTIGKQIVEFEQKGKERSKYGSWLLKKLSADLSKQFGKGFSIDNLENMRNLYLYRPKLIPSTMSSKSWNSETLSRKSIKLSRSHYLRLMRINDNDERRFYEIETIANNWSVRELSRQFNSSFYERLALSKNKEKVDILAKKWQIIEKSEDMIKDPYVLEFLWLDEKSEYSESDLEKAIIDNIGKFLLELGKWFAFVGRQQRISSWPKHRYIDLVFYNRLLRCFVLIDLKIWDLTHQDMWQMLMYVNRYDREVKSKAENPTVWLILCKKNDKVVIEYTLPKNNKHIFAKEYKLYLPDKQQLQQFLEKKNA